MDQIESHGHDDPNDWRNKLPIELRRMISMATFFTNKMDANSFLITRLITGFCRSCTLLRSKILLVDEAGAPLGIDKGIYQHHVNLLPLNWRPNEPSFAAVCPDHDRSFYPVGGFARPEGMDLVGHVFATQAVENFTLWYTARDRSLDSGYHSDGWPVMMGAEIVNYNPVGKKVYVAVDLEYLEGIHGRSAIVMPLSVTGWFNSTVPCCHDG
jgi:hypothetical protein